MKKRIDRKLTEEKIDAIVQAQADDDSAWTPPMKIRRARPLRVSLSGPPAARIGFLAKLQKAKNSAEWVQTVIEDRLPFEESALGDPQASFENIVLVPGYVLGR